LKLWIGASAADVALRLTAQLASTVVLARILAPEEFGIALMVLSITALIGAFVGAPFEEALAQRKRLTTGHIRASLFASLSLTVAAVALTVLLAPLIAKAAGAPSLSLWLPVAVAFLICEGPSSIARALSRRYFRFVELAACQSTSVVIASAAAIFGALAGWGVLALVLQRMLPIALYPILAISVAWWRRRALPTAPEWHGRRFNELFRFSALHQTEVGIYYLTPVALTFLVNAYFGTAVLGQLNIALRLVEPVRTAITGIGHNLAFSLLVRMQDDPRRLVIAAGAVASNVGTIAVPAFLGIGVTTPVLLPLLVGPGWEDAIPVAQLLCAAGAVFVPFSYYFTGYSSLGRPEYGVLAMLAGLLVMVVALDGAARLGLEEAVGLAVLLKEVAIAGVAVAFALRVAGSAVIDDIKRLARLGIAAAAMVGAVHWLHLESDPNTNRFVLLGYMVAVGVLVYAAALIISCRPCIENLRRSFFPQKDTS
jgi:O-antigen/teichoic acid export membrane protein